MSKAGWQSLCSPEKEDTHWGHQEAGDPAGSPSRSQDLGQTKCPKRQWPEPFQTILRTAGLHAEQVLGSKRGFTSTTDTSGQHAENQRQGTHLKAAGEQQLVIGRNPQTSQPTSSRSQEAKMPGDRGTACSPCSAPKWVHPAPCCPCHPIQLGDEWRKQSLVLLKPSLGLGMETGS